jgi:hypothetical protein
MFASHEKPEEAPEHTHANGSDKNGRTALHVVPPRAGNLNAILVAITVDLGWAGQSGGPSGILTASSRSFAPIQWSTNCVLRSDK